MENDKIMQEAIKKVALEYFLFGKEPSMDLNGHVPKDVMSNQSDNLSGGSSCKSKGNRDDDTISRMKKLQPKLPSKKKSLESNFEFEDSLPTGMHISPKQQTSKFKDIQAKEVDESTRERYGEIYSQQPFSSPSMTSSLIDLGFSDED